jgi:hypothetical protein
MKQRKLNNIVEPKLGMAILNNVVSQTLFNHVFINISASQLFLKFQLFPSIQLFSACYGICHFVDGIYRPVDGS